MTGVQTCALPILFQKEEKELEQSVEDRLEGRPDAAVIDRAGIAGAVGKEKMFVYVSVRPSRQTARNIDTKSVFTLNVPSRSQLEQAGFCGSVSAISGDQYIDKFAVTGLTFVKGSQVDAPMIQECPISIKCKGVILARELSIKHDVDPDEIVSVGDERRTLCVAHNAP